MLDQNQLNEKLEQSPSDVRLTPDRIKSKVAKTEFHRLTETLTVCVLTTLNGFTIVGKSACADPANYNKEIGEKVAYDDAEKQLWPLEGYLLREKITTGAVLSGAGASGTVADDAPGFASREG